ncbi:MAG: histidine kinase [Nitrospiraceae bacterium]|nr:histidine kinase [Nitrospiraceae bacterium]
MEKDPTKTESPSLAGEPLRGVGVGRGRLKIYLGWAPGSGKTRRALLDIRAMAARGIDVAIGWLEDKGRPDLLDLARGLPVIAPRSGVWSGIPWADLDVGAILLRRPATLLVDELARTGPPPEAMPSWQTVERLLEEGISVVGTLNALHISELSGAASQILGYSVSEIVPVDFVRRADELVLVDLPPSELLQRIREGQVFGPEKEVSGRSPFLSEVTLNRLRDMTLQFSAKVLDASLTRQGGEKGIYERVTVLVSEQPETFRILLDYGSALSRRLGGELLVLHLEPLPLWGRIFAPERALPDSFRTAVREAGGKLSVLRTRNMAFTLWRFIERTRTTRVVLGHAGTLHPWRKSLVRSVLRHFPRIDVEVTLVPTLNPVVPDPGRNRSGVRPLGPLPGLGEGHAGRFTLFLGAAAGIGKTYRMLQEAREKLGEGRRVMVGFLETHGRTETESMARGLPVIARKRVSYRGLLLEEMDLDAILSARPEIVLVDELAHTNPPGFPLRKRYQDVLRILSAGIDVFSTLNVQHIESLNDLVELQTGIRVRETVPDSVVAMADDLVLVDLTAEELQRRLLEGKVYPPEKIESSLENFFTTKNLTALREFALTSALRSESTAEGIVLRGGRVLAGVSARPEDLALVRRGARISERLNLDLVVLSVRTSQGEGTEETRRISELVQSFGGEFRTETGPSWEETFVMACQKMRPALVLLGQSAWRPGFESTAEKIARRLTSFPLLIIPLDIRDHRQG